MAIHSSSISPKWRTVLLLSILTVLLALVWSFAIVTDSAQFSAALSERTERERVGTALTLVTIRVPPIQALMGWRWAFAFLAIEPVVGGWGMVTLQRSDEAGKLGGGDY